MARDADRLAVLAQATFPLACPPGTLKADIEAHVARHLTAETFQAAAASAQARIFVAENTEGDLVGYTLIYLDEPTDPAVIEAITARPTSELSKCYVLPSCHGTPVARLLVQASIEEAARCGAAGMWLGVNGRNTRAQAFYRKMGFEPVGTRRFVVGGEVHADLVLERNYLGKLAKSGETK